MIVQRTANAFSRPGIYFHDKTPSIGLDLPPLDVAAFVGFAERGPLDIPVAVEDVDTFRSVFGSDLALARRSDSGRQDVVQTSDDIRFASLPSAVAHFFANGGRRCYVVRVAGPAAVAAQFCLPGVVSMGQLLNGEAATSPDPARITIAASSPGEWAKVLRLGSQVRMVPLPADAFTLVEPALLQWRTDGRETSVVDGELLQVTLAHEEGPRLLLLRRDEGDNLAGDTQEVPLTVQCQWRLIPSATALDSAAALPSPTDEREIFLGTLDGLALLTCDGSRPLETDGELIWRLGDDEAGFSLRLPAIDSPASLLPVIDRGDLLRARFTPVSSPQGTTELLLPVEEVRAVLQSAYSPEPDSPLAPPWSGDADIRLGTLLDMTPPELPSSPLPEILSVERLRFDLLLQEGESQRTFLRDLGFHHTHVRFWGDRLLLESSSLFQGRTDDDQAIDTAAVFRSMQQPERTLRLEETGLDVVAWAGRLAPVAEREREDIYLPIGMVSLLTTGDLYGPLLDSPGDDDLLEFRSDLFLDPVLVPDASAQSRSGSALRQQATDRYYVQNQRLYGLHSLFPIDEVALIAIPDAVHVCWTPAPVPTPDPKVEPAPPLPPDESRFHDCNRPAEPESGGEITSPPDESAAEVLAADESLPIMPDLRLLDRTTAFSAAYATLLELHQALVNIGQARRDLVAILTLPEHFEKSQCLAWSSGLRARLGLPTRNGAYSGIGDLVDLSYAAVYHPWLYGIDTVDANRAGRVRTVPPDGAVCGMIAARALARGVWIAPANVALPNVLGLQPRIADGDWADLFEQGFNLVRAEPRDFRAMSAHTLSDEREWRQLSVRRLLILLRKVALERGMDYVFENNGERLQNSIQLVLERLLQSMFARGAFAGATPQQSYRIVTDQRVNRPQDRDNGRFIAEIQVAPSQPTEFITVRLLRTVDGGIQATEIR